MNKRLLIVLILLTVVVISSCAKRIPINSQDTILWSECSKQGGHLASGQNDLTACQNSEIDLGRIKDVKCLCQCCKPK